MSLTHALLDTKQTPKLIIASALSDDQFHQKVLSTLRSPPRQRVLGAELPITQLSKTHSRVRHVLRRQSSNEYASEEVTPTTICFPRAEREP